mgnify:CR=1 FL=1
MAGDDGRARPLCPTDFLKLAGLAVLLPAVAASLRLRGYRRTQTLLQSLAPARASGAEASTQAIAEARHLGRLVSIAAARGPFRVHCLTRSLLLEALLRRRGVAPELHFGARREGPDLHAHAWVSLNGTVVNDRDDIAERYPTMTAPGQRPH